MMRIGVFRLHQGNRFLGPRALRRFFGAESGVTAIEYSILAALVGVVLIAVVTKIGTEIKQTFDNLAASMSVTVADTSGTDAKSDGKEEDDDDDDDDHHGDD